eukprot:5892257-Lingulodinium_polyedra.AAC.1
MLVLAPALRRGKRDARGFYLRARLPRWSVKTAVFTPLSGAPSASAWVIPEHPANGRNAQESANTLPSQLT